MHTLEICCYNYSSAIIAVKAGAHRIELCNSLEEGGVTPSFGLIKLVKENISIDVYPIIRPRGGHFNYTHEEYEIMKKDIEVCKTLECNGVVIGILTSDGFVDKQKCASLVQLAYPMEVTFHRAFDRCNDPFKALEDIIDIGCGRILSSGQQPTAEAGIDLLKQLIQKANERIIIMPGAGIRSSNIATIVERTAAFEFHSSASINYSSQYSFSTYTTCSEEEITKMLNTLKSIEKEKAINDDGFNQ